MVLLKRMGQLDLLAVGLSVRYHERTMKQNGRFTIGRVTVRIYLRNSVVNGKEHVMAMETVKCM